VTGSRILKTTTYERRPIVKRFPFSKRAIEALPPHEMDSPSREAEYTDMECIGLHLRVSKYTSATVLTPIFSRHIDRGRPAWYVQR
jgi:hypothetical protein